MSLQTEIKTAVATKDRERKDSLIEQALDRWQLHEFGPRRRSDDKQHRELRDTPDAGPQPGAPTIGLPGMTT